MGGRTETVVSLLLVAGVACLPAVGGVGGSSARTGVGRVTETPATTQPATPYTTTPVSDVGGLVFLVGGVIALIALVGLVSLITAAAAGVTAAVVWLFGPFDRSVTLALPPAVGVVGQLVVAVGIGWLGLVPLVVQVPILLGVGELLHRRLADE